MDLDHTGHIIGMIVHSFACETCNKAVIGHESDPPDSMIEHGCSVGVALAKAYYAKFHKVGQSPSTATVQ